MLILSGHDRVLFDAMQVNSLSRLWASHGPLGEEIKPSQAKPSLASFAELCPKALQEHLLKGLPTTEQRCMYIYTGSTTCAKSCSSMYSVEYPSMYVDR